MQTANDYYNPMPNNPGTRCRANVPPGAKPREAPTAMPPPARDHYYQARPVVWLRLMPVLRQVHSPLGGDMEIGEVLFDIMGDDYNARPPFSTDFTNLVIEVEATSGAVIGKSRMGKTRTLRRLLSHLSHNYANLGSAEAKLRLDHEEALRKLGKDEQVDRTCDQLDAQAVATKGDKQAVLDRHGSIEGRNRTAEGTDLDAVASEQAKNDNARISKAMHGVGVQIGDDDKAKSKPVIPSAHQ